MKILEFLSFLAIINVFIRYVYKYIVLVPYALLFAFGGGNRCDVDIRAYLLKLFGFYIQTALVVLLILRYSSTTFSAVPPVALYVLGTLYILLNMAGYYFGVSGEEHNLDALKYERYIVIISMALYVAAFVAPNIVTNKMTIWTLSVVDWIYNLGWLVRVPVLLLLANMTLYGMLAVGVLTGVVPQIRHKQ